MTRSVAFGHGLCLCVLLGSAATAADSPYVDLQQRPVKALSADEAEGLLAGHGLGMALPAELNRYPGPKHVLELGEEMELTAAQRDATGRAYDVMHARAVELGRAIVDRETALDEAFRNGAVDDAALADHVREIAKLRGELRLAHLRAHLRMVEILEREQVERYVRLRGYDSDAGASDTPAECPHHPGAEAP